MLPELGVFEDLETDLESEFEYGLESETGQYELYGHDSRVLVTRTTDAPYRYICNLEYNYDGIGRWAMCSGTLIGPRTVLTAGHCISGRTASRMRVIPGRNGSLEPLPATQATRLIPAPGYAPASSTDYGIIHLRDPVGSMIGYWTRGYTRRKKDSVGTSMSGGALPWLARFGILPVHVSGYPADKPEGPKLGCRKTSGPEGRCRNSLLGAAGRNRLCGTYQYRSSDRRVRVQGGMLTYEADTCPGHSGSPIWLQRNASNGGRVLIGVHVAGGNKGVCLTTAIIRWILSNTI